jgi:diguanylate cyclase (GGDEF)-like protein
MGRSSGTSSARTLRGGKIVFNDRRSVVDCLVRSLSDRDATLGVESTTGLPRTFDLLISGERESRPCVVDWQTENRVAVSFWPPDAGCDGARLEQAAHSKSVRPTLVRGSLVALRTSLDEVDFGVVLLDADLHATFVNRAFRRLWQLPEDATDCRPAFVDLMRHGQTVLWGDVPSEVFVDHVNATLARAHAGDSTPVDLRLPNGEVLRFQCFALPCGGRMLSYTLITDIVRRSDELQVLRDAIENIEQGIVLIDEALVVRFANKKAREYWGLTLEQCHSRMSLVDYITHVKQAGLYSVPEDAIEDYVIKRVTMIKSGDQTPFDIPVTGGRTIRAQCTALAEGGRMLSYTEVSDLVDRAEQQEKLATTDVLTGLYNRRQFMRIAEAEWDRFKRYQRNFSLIYFDIDNFKAINDRLGHDAGDRAIMRVAEVCSRQKRGSDILARMGGDEFVVLMPETGQETAHAFAERLRCAVSSEPLDVDGIAIDLTVSIGVAVTDAGLDGIKALLKIADARLYLAKKEGRNCIA